MKINTNLSSLIVQNNLTKSTNALNQAIERMTTGYKINHASDNAANYSIVQNMSSKLSSYTVAQDNVASGIDMVATAQDTISLMQSHGERILALWTQAQNGTYGNASLDAIQSEVNARVAEINRLYDNAEFNGISLFNTLPDWAKEVKNTAGAVSGDAYGAFISDPTARDEDGNAIDTDSLTKLSEVTATTISSGTYAIGSKADLVKLQTMVNNGKITGGTFVMSDDIDLGGEEWTAIGTSSKEFKGTFDGNGHKITGLKIDKPETDYQGLFGCTSRSSTIKNVGVEGVDVTGGNYTGGLVGWTFGSITNSYATGNVTGGKDTGGLVGFADGNITDSYATGNIFGRDYTGKLVGATNGSIANSYATGNVSGGSYTGGLAGVANIITNSYSTGDVTGENYTGGLIGLFVNDEGPMKIENAYTTSKVTGQSNAGSLIGQLVDFNAQITNALSLSQGLDKIGIAINPFSGSTITLKQEWLDAIEENDSATTLQVGINSDSSSQISLDSSIDVNLGAVDIKSASTYDKITAFLNSLSSKSTELGAVTNRLESALDSIGVSIENLTSSRSTLQDADIAQVSSDYIRQQILQQAAATLLATANQSPAIALQLI